MQYYGNRLSENIFPQAQSAQRRYRRFCLFRLISSLMRFPPLAVISDSSAGAGKAEVL